MKSPRLLLLALALTAPAGSAFAQFTDPFDTISSAWTANRYAPAGFASVVFDGGHRLRLTLDATGAAANRPPAFSSSFYDIQGMQRPGNLTGPWSLSAQVFVSSAFNTTTGLLAASELWGHTGTTPSGGDYLIFGFTNASPTNPLNAGASDRSFRFQAFDSTTDTWLDLGLPSGFVFDTWHTLTGTSTGSVFEYRLDGALVHTRATVAGADLLSAMVQGYNFGEAAGYSVHWDNVTASAIPEPATTTLLVAAAGLAFAAWRHRRAPRPAPAG
jgi:hypothetical protein